jgi:hypothetical protein
MVYPDTCPGKDKILYKDGECLHVNCILRGSLGCNGTVLDAALDRFKILLLRRMIDSLIYIIRSMTVLIRRK